MSEVTKESLKENMIETASWALDQMSEMTENLDADGIQKVLDSTSKLINQINEMDKIELEAKEKEASRIQQAELDRAKLDADVKSNQQKIKSENRKGWIELGKIGGTLVMSVLSAWAYNQIFKMHKHDDFMTGTEKDALNMLKGIDRKI